MILPRVVALAVADGRVSLAYRRWARPRVKVGSTFLSASGVIEITAVEQVDPATISDADARAAGAESAAAVRKRLREPATDPVFRVGLAWAGPDPRDELSSVSDLSDAEVADLAEQLGRLDRRSTHGAWTHQTLRLIEARPAVRAADLAASMGRERDPFKLDVRKLKNLGLTHSLEVGYRLSPRGDAYLRARDLGSA
ncbi:MAG: hypothetical protein ACRDO7_03915 [Nocardioidaceae bacterium]